MGKSCAQAARRASSAALAISRALALLATVVSAMLKGRPIEQLLMRDGLEPAAGFDTLRLYGGGERDQA